MTVPVLKLFEMKALMMPKLLKTFSILSVCVVTNACVSVLPKTEPPAPRYTISAVTAQDGASVDWSLVIDDPTSSQLYNGVKIALSRAPNRFEFYAGTEWTDRAPSLFQRALVRSFENSNRLLNVDDHTTLAVGDYHLKTDIRAFHVDRVGTPAAVLVTMFARVQNKAGETIAVKEFAKRERVDAESIANVMSGFDRALDGMLLEIMDWTFEVTPSARENEALEDAELVEEAA